MSSSDPASGSVVALSGGWPELSSILEACASRSRAVVVDYYATWCGPCRMLAPVLEGLARQHVGKACFVKVDCEGTPANAQLARQERISAFPTVVVFAGRDRTEVVRGADVQAIRRALADAVAKASRGANLVPQVLAALQLLKRSTETDAAGNGGAAGPSAAAASSAAAAPSSSAAPASTFVPSAFVVAAKTLLSCAQNVLSHPSEPKYRRIRENNAAVRARLLRWRGGGEALEALGFARRVEASESLFAMDDVPADLERVVGLLDQAVRMGEAADALRKEAEEKKRKEEQQKKEEQEQKQGGGEKEQEQKQGGGEKEQEQKQGGGEDKREQKQGDAEEKLEEKREEASEAGTVNDSAERAQAPVAAEATEAPSPSSAPPAAPSAAPSAASPAPSSAPSLPSSSRPSAAATAASLSASLPPGLATGPLAAWASTASAPSSPTREAQRNVTAKVCAKLLEKLMLQAEEEAEQA